ncbi:MAG: hypothetical protein FJX42_05425 [Alphaproteobacteria bacterium]|nr:hypothetical protein [Alphaproteobacteria bacterium]
MITVHGLSPNIEVLVSPGQPPLSADLHQAVMAAWVAERARRPNLTDGSLFSIEDFSPQRITGRLVPYRRLVAARVRPELAARLAVRPLAVSGLLSCADGIVFGHRAPGVTDDAGRWELVPSGGVDDKAATGDRVDLGRQILSELHEEIGLESGDVSGLDIFCAVEDSETGTVDIGIALTTPLPAVEVHRGHKKCGDGEYAEIEIVAPDKIAAFVAGRGASLITVSRALLTYRNLPTSAR